MSQKRDKPRDADDPDSRQLRQTSSGALANQVALITGGASGQGAAEAALFASEGASVVIADVQDELGEALARSIGSTAAYVHLDVSRDEEWSSAVEFTSSCFGAPSILVNSAGVVHRQLIEESTVQEFEELLAVNLIGTFLGMKAALPSMRRLGGGAIVNIGSTAGMRGAGGRALYAASKWGVRGLTKSAAVEFGRYGVRVNCINPGSIDTPMLGDTRDSLGVPNVPLSRFGRAAEVAEAALFLASDRAGYITGADLAVDGGDLSGRSDRKPALVRNMTDHAAGGAICPPILSGLRIVEFSAFVAAPLAGTTLASLGADVIRIEARGGGVDARRWPLYGGRSLYRTGLDTAKRSVALNLNSPRGREIASAIVTASGEDAGIFLTNLGATGWSSYDRLAKDRPDLIMVVLSGMPDGRTAVDYTVNAATGFPLITGRPDTGGPTNHVLPAWDVAAGFLMALAVLAADRHRRTTGTGQRVDLALSDVALAVADRLGYLAEAELVPEPHPRLGNDIFGTYGRDFRTSDGRDVFITALTSRQWTSLVDATSLATEFVAIEARHGVDLRHEDARFACREEISALIEAWVAQRTLDDAREIFEDAGVVWGPYRSFKELVRDDPRAQAPPASPLRFEVNGIVERQPTPPIGADTEAVLAEVLGMAPTEVRALRAEGIID